MANKKDLDKNFIRKEWNNYKSSYEIAGELGVSHGTILNRAKEMNINTSRKNRPKVKQSKTMKKLFKEGKIKIWSTGLTKETDERLKKSAEKCSKIRKKHCSEGKIKSWNKGLTKETDERVKSIGIKNSLNMKRLYKEGKFIPPMYIDGRSKLLAPARYGDDWDKIRYLVYLRDHFTCQDCGITRKRLDIHHITPFLKTRDNSLGNLITLCRSCHTKRDQKLILENKEIKICP